MFMVSGLQSVIILGSKKVSMDIIHNYQIFHNLKIFGGLGKFPFHEKMSFNVPPTYGMI